MSESDETAVLLSAAVITFNEEDKLADCLSSLHFVDEIVVIDSHSTDATREIAASYGARVIERDWAGHISQKNFALEQCRGQWVISLDADERASAKLCQEIKKVLKNPLADGYAIARKVYYINRWIEHCGWYPAKKQRLVRRAVAKWQGQDPHDRLDVQGVTGQLAGDIYHLSFDSIHDHISTIDSFTAIGAREAKLAGKKPNLLDITLRPLFTFVKMYVLKAGFLDGVSGFIASAFSGFHTFTKYQRMHQMYELDKNGDLSRKRDC